jgi:hypothetical protein
VFAAKATDYLTWEPAVDCNCDPPLPVNKFYPNWFKNLSNNLLDYQTCPHTQNQTVRNCLGFRGLSSIGYTMPLPQSVGDTTLSRNVRPGLTPQQISGTKWAKLDHNGQEKYVLRILDFPWRARLAKGWRLLATAYMFDWSDDYFCFSGAIEPNYQSHRNNTTIGSNFVWDIEMDFDNYNYVNVETVFALKKGSIIPANTCLFTLIPIYDPTHKPLKYP